VAETDADNDSPSDARVGEGPDLNRPDGAVLDGVRSVSLVYEDTIRVDHGNIWSGLSTHDGLLNLTTMSGGQLSLVRYNTDMQAVTRMVPLTTADDYPSDEHIADHAHLLLGEHLYLAYSTHHADDLYLIKTDLQGRRIGERAVLVENGRVGTNDMHIASDGQTVYVEWGPAGYEHWVQGFDTDLTPRGERLQIEPPVPLPQLGSTVFHEGEFLMFTGEERQRTLVVSRWSADWEAGDPFHTPLIESVDDEWNWFASGAVFDPSRGLWFVAYNHMYDTEEADRDRTIDLAVFDADFELLWHDRVTDAPAMRPHLTLVENQLFLAYDSSGVWLQRYTLRFE